MKAQISETMLKRISQDINCGRPLWALFTANEYLEARDPLRMALAAKAKRQLSEHHYQAAPMLAQLALAGKTVAELSQDQRRLLRSISEQSTVNTTRYRFTCPNRQLQRQKNRLRTRIAV